MLCIVYIVCTLVVQKYAINLKEKQTGNHRKFKGQVATEEFVMFRL